MSEPQRTPVGPGMLALTTYGDVKAETAQSLIEMRAFCERNGLRDVLWTWISGSLVDKARNEAARTFLGATIDKKRLEWLIFCDCDMVVPPNAVDLLLDCAY